MTRRPRRPDRPLPIPAVEEKLERDPLQKVLDQMDREYGPLTQEDLAWADHVLQG